MSVMTQSHEPCASAARNSAADANPRAPYSSEQSDSTSAVRNGSSSSMTAIKSSFDTLRPFPGLPSGDRTFRMRRGCQETIHECYAGLSRLLGPYHIGHADEIGQGPRAHFSHGRASMNFHRDLAYSQIAGDLLVHLAGCHQQHHLLFRMDN